MAKDSDNPLAGYSPAACIAKFVVSFVIGLCVDAAIFFGFLYMSPGVLPGLLVPILLILPFIWGILGIVFFEPMTEIFNRDAYTKTRR